MPGRFEIKISKAETSDEVKRHLNTEEKKSFMF